MRQGKRENDLLRQERDSLKKARGIFSRGQLGNCNSWPSRASSTRSPCCAKRWRFARAALMPGKAGRLPTTVEKMPSSQAKSSRFCLPHRQVSGSPPIHAVLKARGRPCSRKPVLRLMHQLGLSAGAKRSRKPTTKSDPRARFAPNHLNRELTAEQPTSKWVSDTKAVEPAEGWLYLAVILDLFSRMLGGWAMAATEDGALVELALRMAVARRLTFAGLLHHSDRGTEFPSDRSQAALRELGIEVSMSRTATCWEKVAMESFFATLTKECLDRPRFQSRQPARSAMFEDLECFDHPIRFHST